MTQTDTLLAEFARSGSEHSFRQLVERHIGRVYSTALRILSGDTHAAQDVTQTVFCDLARSAKSLPIHTVLEAWLHRHTCFVSLKWLRTEARRRRREQQAMEEMKMQNHTEANLDNLRLTLDSVINTLGAKDRAAILLRYFEKSDFEAIARALNTTPASAQRRVSRALEKLRELLRRNGAPLSAASLLNFLSAEAATVTPPALTNTIVQTALAGMAANTFSPVTLIKALVMNKAKFAAGLAIFGIGSASLVVQQGALNEARQNAATLAAELARTQEEAQQLSSRLVSASTKSTVVAQNPELLRLRSEVDQWRARAQQAEQTLARRSASPEKEKVEPQLLPIESLRWTGYESPESSFQTVIWAMHNGSYQSLLNSCTEEGRRALSEQFAGKSNEEIEAALKAGLGALTAIRLDRKKQLADNEVSFTLRIEEQDDGATRFRDEAVMRFVSNGSAWLYNP